MRCTSKSSFDSKSFRRSRKRIRTVSGNSWGFRKKKQRRKQVAGILIAILLVAVLGAAAVFFIHNYDVVAAYEKETYANNIYQSELVTDQLCVVNEDVAYDAFQSDEEFHAVALFENSEYKVLCAQNVHEKIYPASTTKILTAYIALKYGDLSEIVTVGENAMRIPADSSVAWLLQGDKLTLEALLYALMLPSGNDGAVAIAEHLSGSVDAFVELMNKEAKLLGATNSNFTSPHGYQDENHYTTAYDLYLIFNQCLKNEKFIEVISSYAYDAEIESASGSKRNVTWRQSNQYVIGMQEIPEGIEVVGGKTGTTDEAGACLIQYVKEKASDTPYISIIMGAETRPVLYENMTALISTIKLE